MLCSFNCVFMNIKLFTFLFYFFKLKLNFSFILGWSDYIFAPRYIGIILYHPCYIYSLNNYKNEWKIQKHEKYKNKVTDPSHWKGIPTFQRQLFVHLTQSLSGLTLFRLELSSLLQAYCLWWSLGGEEIVVWLCELRETFSCL